MWVVQSCFCLFGMGNTWLRMGYYLWFWAYSPSGHLGSKHWLGMGTEWGMSYSVPLTQNHKGWFWFDQNNSTQHRLTINLRLAVGHGKGENEWECNKWVLTNHCEDL